MRKGKRTTAPKRGITKDSAYFDEFNRFSEKIRKRINDLRGKNELTQEQMEEFEIGIRQFQRIESGETKNITISTLYKLAVAFGVKPSQLIDV